MREKQYERDMQTYRDIELKCGKNKTPQTIVHSIEVVWMQAEHDIKGFIV